MSAQVSAAARTLVRIRSQVPSTAHLISRLRAVLNEPSSTGRSRQGEQARYVRAMAREQLPQTSPTPQAAPVSPAGSSRPMA